MKKEGMYQSTPNWSFCKTKNPQEYLKGTERLISPSWASKGQWATSTCVQGQVCMGVSQRAHPGRIYVSTVCLAEINGCTDPELLPLAQSEVISHFQTLCRSEVHLVERVLQSYSSASLSAMRQPGSIPFPFNPGARLTLPRSTPKSAVSIPGLRFLAAFPTKPSNATERHKIRSWQRSPRPVALRPKQPGTPH